MPRDELRTKPARVTEDCFAALVRLFMSPANPKWAKYAQNTRALWQRELMVLARPDALGAVSLQAIRPALIQACLDGFDGRPGKQAAMKGVLVALEKWAIVRDLLPRPITTGVETERPQGGHIPWTDAQLELGERHARADIARALTLAANTGQRGSDLVRLGPTDMEVYEGIPGHNVIQVKTKRKVWVPVTSALASAMETWERRPGPYLTRPSGGAWERKSLTAAWTYERDTNPALAPLAEAGLVLHGLRGTACVRLRRSGATAEQIGDMVGMSVEMVARYCRFSVQRENAAAAVIHLERTIRDRNLDKSKRGGV